MKWIFLAGAILSEVTASLSLKAALDNPALFIVVVLGYAASFASWPGSSGKGWASALPTASGLRWE